MTDHHIRTPPAAAEVVERERNTHDGYEAVDMDPEPTFREDERKEQDAETSEVSEDGESEREDEYNFQFEGEMDPLLFVEGEGTSSLPLYEVFQRIEDQYKALAAMKRPAPDNNESEMPAKRLRQDEETTGATREEIEEAMNFGVRKRKSRKERRRGRKKGSKNKVSPEVTRKLGRCYAPLCTRSL